MTEMTENRKYPQSPLRNFYSHNFRGKIEFRSFRSSPADRARQYVAKIPPAISGQGGHNQTFAVAVSLLHGFALTESEAWPILMEYGAICSPPWSFDELRHKLADAGKITRHPKPRGHLLGFRPLPPAQPSPKAEPLSLGRVTIPHTPTLAASPSTPQPDPEIDMIEACRVAGELLKMHEEGFIVGTDDPDARLYAQTLRLFRASFIPPTKREDAPPCHEHSIPKTP